MLKTKNLAVFEKSAEQIIIYSCNIIIYLQLTMPRNNYN